LLRTYYAIAILDGSGWWMAHVPNIVGAQASAQTWDELPALILAATARVLDVAESDIEVRLDGNPSATAA